MPEIRILQGYNQKSDAQLIGAAGAAIQGLTGNPKFASPPVDLETVQAALDELVAAVAAQPHGGTTATAHKKNKRAALAALMSKLAHYVQDNCDGDLAGVVSAGFRTASVGGRVNIPMEKPSIKAIVFGNSTELVVRVKPVWRAKVYDLRTAPIGEGGAPGPWQSVGLFTNCRGIKVATLRPLTTYRFQVRAIGATGASDWSDAVFHLCL
jgi:hypothetical protein